MNALTFAQPVWFWGLLLLIPLVALRARAHWHTARQLPGLVSPRLAARLISGSSHRRRWTVFTLHCLALVALLAALARPMLGHTEIETVTDARNLLLAIDTSRSMMAADLPPNRLTRAKLAAKDIILSLPEDRIGLIAFAGRPFVQAPLTVDHEAVIEAIDQLDTEIIPRGGTNLSAATALALETFREAELEQSALVIFSDGEALEGMDQLEKIRDEAKAAGMSILTVGVGSAEGAIIPETDENGVPVPGLFVKDDQGQVVRTRLVADALRSLSSGGGAYVSLAGHTSLTHAVEQITKGLASSREESETRLRPIERFMWPLGAATALLVLAHLLPLFWLKPSPPSTASSAPARRLAAGVTLFFGTLLFPAGSALARDSIRQGYEAYQEDNFAASIEAYEGALTERLTPDDRTRLHMGIGAAAYRLGDYERAAEAYGRALVEGNETRRGQTHYNLGNTLFRQGETTLRSSSDPDQPQRLTGPDAAVEDTIRDWEASIEHFETTLSLDPGNPRAAHNLELVKQRLEDLKKQQEEEQKKEEQQKEEESKNEPEEKDEQEQEEDKKDEGENQNEEKKEGEQEQKDPKEDAQDPPKDKDGDGQPDDPQEKPGKEDPQNPGEGEPKNDPSSQEPQKGEGEKPDPENASDKKNPGEGQSDKENTPQNPGQNPPAPPEAPQDGKLEADPNRAQPQNRESSGQPGQAETAAGQQINPTTGYSPSEARQLLESLADETEVRPFVQPSRGETFKNW